MNEKDMKIEVTLTAWGWLRLTGMCLRNAVVTLFDSDAKPGLSIPYGWVGGIREMDISSETLTIAKEATIRAEVAGRQFQMCIEAINRIDDYFEYDLMDGKNSFKANKAFVSEVLTELASGLRDTSTTRIH